LQTRLFGKNLRRSLADDQNIHDDAVLGFPVLQEFLLRNACDLTTQAPYRALTMLDVVSNAQLLLFRIHTASAWART